MKFTKELVTGEEIMIDFPEKALEISADHHGMDVRAMMAYAADPLVDQLNHGVDIQLRKLRDTMRDIGLEREMLDRLTIDHLHLKEKLLTQVMAELR